MIAIYLLKHNSCLSGFRAVVYGLWIFMLICFCTHPYCTRSSCHIIKYEHWGRNTWLYEQVKGFPLVPVALNSPAVCSLKWYFLYWSPLTQTNNKQIWPWEDLGMNDLNKVQHNVNFFTVLKNINFYVVALQMITIILCNAQTIC